MKGIRWLPVKYDGTTVTEYHGTRDMEGYTLARIDSGEWTATRRGQLVGTYRSALSAKSASVRYEFG